MNNNTNCVCNFTINGICYSANISRTHCYKQYIIGDQLGKKTRITHWEYAYMLNAFEYGADSDLASEQNGGKESKAVVKKISAREAKKINAKNGIETWEEDGQKTYWAAFIDESGTFSFDSKKERDEFVAKRNSFYDSDAAYIKKAYEELRIDEIEWAEDHIEIVNHEQESLAIIEASHWNGIFFVSYKQEGVFNIEQFDNLDDAKMFARNVAINEANWQKEQRRAEYEAELAQYEIAPGVREIGNVYYINGREDEVAEIMPSYVGHNKVVWNLIRRGGAHLLFNTYDTIEEARQVARAHSICIHKLLNQ